MLKEKLVNFSLTMVQWAKTTDSDSVDIGSIPIGNFFNLDNINILYYLL